jgi:hypothetical protein
MIALKHLSADAPSLPGVLSRHITPALRMLTALWHRGSERGRPALARNSAAQWSWPKSSQTGVQSSIQTAGVLQWRPHNLLLNTSLQGATTVENATLGCRQACM